MSELPPGFELDQMPSGHLGLPPGFELDEPQQGSGIGMNVGAGLNDVIYSTLGAPVDLPRWLINTGISGVNAVAGSDIPTIPDEYRASGAIARTAERYLGVPNPENVQAVTPGEKVARGVGQGVASAVAPELMLRGGVETLGAKVNPYLEAAFGRSAGAGDVAANAVVGGAAGGTGKAAAEAVPEQWQPVADIAGNLAGGGVGALATMAPRAVRAGVDMAADYAAPLTASGRERMAATTLRDAASDPYAARDALEAPGQIVPGSQPTTFQQSGDMGLGALERRAETQNAVPFQQRRADQNMARVDAMEGVQPKGYPEAVVTTLRKNLADLDQMTGEALESATASARGQTAALGGAGTPEGYGATIRQQLGDARLAVKEREKALWDAVDPDGTLALDATDIRNSVVSTLRELPKAAKPMEGEERAIFSAAAGFNGVKPFRELTALRSRASTEMKRERRENGESPAYRRLSMLRGSIERTIEKAVEGKATREAEAVSSGAMNPDDTMLAQWAAAMAAGKETWLADRAGRAGQEAVGYSGGYEPAGPRTVSGASGSEGQGRRGFNDPAGDQGIPGAEPLSPNFDEDAHRRMRVASDATKTRARTYDEGPVGAVLRRSTSDGPFNAPAAAVPEKIFRRGRMGAEGMRALQQASNSPETMATVRDYAISNLRRFAEDADGTLNPAKVAIWRKAHADALRSMPEIDNMLRGPVEAAEAVARVATERKQKLDQYRAGAIGRLIDAAPDDVTRKLGAVFSTENPTRTMRMLEAETRNSPEAREGLRKGIADWIAQRFVSNTEAGTSGQALMRSDQFQQFVRQSESALKVIFSPAEVNVLKSIAADLQRSNRSITAVKLPGRSNTPQDITAEAKRANQPQSWLAQLLTGVGQLAAGTAVTGTPWGGAAAVIGGRALSHFRNEGLQKVDDIIADAMLNPGRAFVLLSKAPPKPTEKDLMTLGQRWRRAGLPATGTVAGGAN